jgi:hypothetical protein
MGLTFIGGNAMARNVSRLDRIISELEKLHSEANDIFDAHVDVLMCDLPRGCGCTSGVERVAPKQANYKGLARKPISGPATIGRVTRPVATTTNRSNRPPALVAFFNGREGRP